MSRVRRILHHWLRDTKGAVMVEFAVLCAVFLLIIAGIMDLGLAFYVKQVVTNASREGARYGVVYVTDANGNRVAPKNFSSADTPSRTKIATYVKNSYLGSAYVPSNATISNPTVTGDSSVKMGDPLQVTVSATYQWIVLDHFVPGMNSTTTISATTVMLLE